MNSQRKIYYILLLFALNILLFPSVLKSQKKFDISRLSLNIMYSYNVYSQYVRKEMQGEKIFDHSFARGNEFGLGMTYTLSNSFFVKAEVSKTYYFGRYYITDSYERALYQLRKLDGVFDDVFGDDYKWSYFQYYKLNISCGYSFILSKKQRFNLYGGVSLMHLSPYSSHQTLVIFDTVKFMDAPLLMSYYANSRYENGSINNYKSIDIGLHMAVQYSIRIFKRLDLLFGINANYTHREIAKGYYKTSASSPMQASGIIVQPIKYIGISGGINYFFTKPK